DVEVVPDFTRFIAELLARALAPAFDGVGVHDPVADVEVMDVLFADMVARKPDVVVPVMDLLFEVGVASVTAMPDWAAVYPVRAQHDDVADGSVLNALDRIDIAGLVAALSTRGNLEAFLLG